MWSDEGAAGWQLVSVNGVAITPELLHHVDGISQRVTEDLAVEHAALLAARRIERDGGTTGRSPPSRRPAASPTSHAKPRAVMPAATSASAPAWTDSALHEASATAKPSAPNFHATAPEMPEPYPQMRIVFAMRVQS